MSRKFISQLAFLVLTFFCFNAMASETPLEAGKPQENTLTAGAASAFDLTLKAGDFVETNVEPHGVELLVTAFGPKGNKVRAFKFGPAGQKVRFVAEDQGPYRLEVALAGKDQKNGGFTITLGKIVSLRERTDPVPAPASFDSPRMKALHAAIEGSQKDAVAAFWDEVSKKGSPLIEPLEGDRKKMLVTFLWKGTADTRNVFVVWPPFSDQWPEDYRMTRLGETDVWYKTLKVEKRKRFIYLLAPNVPPLHATQEPADDGTTAMLEAAIQNDPLNPKHWLTNGENPDAPQYVGWSEVDMPDAPPQPWSTHRDGVPAGQVEKHQFNSALLKNEREVAVYLPPGYSKGSRPYPLVVLFDEKAYLDQPRAPAKVPTPTILDNLIAEKRIPPVVAILLDNPPGARGRELPCNPTFADALNFEFVPWARRLYNVTSDPREIVVGGSSYGGLAAAYAGLRHPETFGNVLSQSGSFWWTPPLSDKPFDFDPDAEPSWVAQQFVASPRLPLRFYMDAGSDELDFSGSGNSILVPNRHLRDVLLAKGYEVHYQEFSSGHDYLSWRGSLADGLVLLLGSDRGDTKEPVAKR